MARDYAGGSEKHSRGDIPFTTISDLTFSMWLNCDASADAEDRFFRFGDGANSVTLGMRFGGTTWGWVDEGVAWRNDAISDLGTGAWRHLLLYRAGSGDVFVEVDGAAVTNFGISPNAVSTDMHVGGVEVNGADWKMAHVATWDAALGEGERLALSKGCSPLMVRPGNLKTYVPLWGVGTDEGDLAVGVLWTAVGTPGAADGPVAAAPILF
jgi:hypothetical protein